MFQSPNKQIVQGITEVSPQYVRIQGLRGDTLQTSITWDMRVAMSAIPPAQLREVLLRNADPNRAQDWLDIVSVYLAAKRYVEAREMLVQAIQRFPELQTSRPEIKRIDQLLAEQMFDAALISQNAGQYMQAEQILRGFEVNTLSVETQLKIERRLEAIATVKKECSQILDSLREDLSKGTDPSVQQEFEPVLEEISKHLTEDTRVRFADYTNLRTDPTLTPDQRIALGFSGWLYGAGLAERNLSVVRSGYIARRMISELLGAKRKNDALIQGIMKLESGTPRYVSRILENMPPAVQTEPTSEVKLQVPSSEDPQTLTERSVPGRFLLEVPTSRELGGNMVRYMVQLPPEYNPYRKYPCVLALPSEELPFYDSLDWWTSLNRYDSQLRCFGDT
jgi:tetratricopeptide (TPR) repeat protein